MKYLTVQATIPSHIKNQLDFIVLYPLDNEDTVMDRSTIKYDTRTKVLSFVITSYGVKNTITEQATPEAFNDIPQYYQKVIDQMNGYSSFDTDIGKVNLTRPAHLNGEQVAVMNTKGVLLFAHPSKDLTQSEWRKFFNNLQVIK